MDRRSAPLLAIHLRLEISSYRAMSSIAVTAATAASTIAQPQLSMAEPGPRAPNPGHAKLFALLWVSVTSSCNPPGVKLTDGSADGKRRL